MMGSQHATARYPASNSFPRCPARVWPAFSQGQVLSAEHRDDGDLRHDLDVSSRGPYRGPAGATSKAVLGRLPEVREVGTRAVLLGAESGELDRIAADA